MGPLRTISVIVLVFLESLVTQILAADHLPIPDRANCNSVQYQCPNGGCIPLDDLCNCVNDCGDGSDEEDCNDMLGSGEWSFTRGNYAYYCPSGGCTKYFAICSHKKTSYTCDDNTTITNCPGVAPCYKLQFECENGKCIHPTEQCDGIDQCGDGSDEMNCLGICPWFGCSNGKCSHKYRACDCNDDCGDGSDENNCSGKTFHCSNGTCLLNAAICNCENDCSDGADEENCDDKTFHCSNGTCLLNAAVCNCENDCGDGADEENCHGRTFHCPNGNCLLSSKICDCEDDCGDGADEENCENGCQKTAFRFWCKHSEKYLLMKYLNDGFDECGDGADENYCSTESFICGIEGCLQNISICENDYGCTNRTDGGSCTGSCQEFQCPGGGPCIHKNKVCDCNDDCGDGADEQNCKPGAHVKHRKYEPSIGDPHDSWEVYVYHCPDGKCFDHKFRRDGYSCNSWPTCSDWSDEMECEGACHNGSVMCDSLHCQNSFQCPSGRCLLNMNSANICDGINDCGDWTDEKNCSDVAINENQFKCRSGQIIDKVCSGICRDGSDMENCDWQDDLRCGFRRPENDWKPSQCNPFGDYPCCSDQGWCGNTPDHCDCPDCIDYRVCTDGTSYQIDNGKSICTCVNGKYECKEKGCIEYSAIILDDGCNYCICSKNGKYEFCTKRTCISKELPGINETTTEEYFTHQASDGEGFILSDEHVEEP